MTEMGAAESVRLVVANVVGVHLLLMTKSECLLELQFHTLEQLLLP